MAGREIFWLSNCVAYLILKAEGVEIIPSGGGNHWEFCHLHPELVSQGGVEFQPAFHFLQTQQGEDGEDLNGLMAVLGQGLAPLGVLLDPNHFHPFGHVEHLQEDAIHFEERGTGASSRRMEPEATDCRSIHVDVEIVLGSHFEELRLLFRVTVGRGSEGGDDQRGLQAVGVVLQ